LLVRVLDELVRHAVNGVSASLNQTHKEFEALEKKEQRWIFVAFFDHDEAAQLGHALPTFRKWAHHFCEISEKKICGAKSDCNLLWAVFLRFSLQINDRAEPHDAFQMDVKLDLRNEIIEENFKLKIENLWPLVALAPVVFEILSKIFLSFTPKSSARVFSSFELLCPK
jgi:hypothetical protein